MFARPALEILFFTIVFVISSCSSDSNRNAGPSDRFDFFVTVEDSSSIIDPTLVAYFRDQQPAIENVLNNLFSLPERDINIVYQDCMVENARYLSEPSEIIMCYRLLAAITNAEDGIYQQGNAMLGMFNWITWHEIGHALIDHYDIPSLGQKEDMADSLATVFFLETSGSNILARVKRARAIVLVGEYMNTLNSGDLRWADAHTVSPQRQYNLVCWAVGAERNIENDANIQQIVTELKAARRICPNEYAEKKAAMEELIGAYLNIDRGGNL